MKPFYALLLFCLTACASSFNPQDLPLFNQDEIRWFHLEQIDADNKKQTSLLLIQGLGNKSSRWIHSDPFGAPLARLIASPEGWRNDGFVAPNPKAKRFFSALFPYIHRQQAFTLNFEGSTWQISPLPQTAPQP